MSYLLNASLSGKSGVSGAGEKKYGGCSGLSEEIFSGCFDRSGVVVLCY